MSVYGNVFKRPQTCLSIGTQYFPGSGIPVQYKFFEAEPVQKKSSVLFDFGKILAGCTKTLRVTGPDGLTGGIECSVGDLVE